MGLSADAHRRPDGLNSVRCQQQKKGNYTPEEALWCPGLCLPDLVVGHTTQSQIGQLRSPKLQLADHR